MTDRKFLKGLDGAFIFAKTMEDNQHWYVKRTSENEEDYIALYRAIEEHGIDEDFQGRHYKVWYAGDGYKYWYMDALSQSRIINRKVEDQDAHGAAAKSDSVK